MDPPRPPHPRDAQLRLVKVQCSVVPREKCVAVVGGHGDGASVGRDRTYMPRLRLPAMEVSKHHASLFCDPRVARTRETREPDFCITDTGSTHGTFVCRRWDALHPSHAPIGGVYAPISREELAKIPDAAFYRLSPPKHASRPLPLRHLDLVRFGGPSSTFEVHLHWPPWASCEVCKLSLDGGNEISLDSQASARRTAPMREAPTALRSAASSTDEGKRNMELDRRKRLRAIKHAYTEPEGERSTPQETAYRDRAALRRALHPGEEPVRTERGPPPAEPEPPELPFPEVSEPAAASGSAAPLDASNVGFQMLARMGGDAGLCDAAPVMPKVAAGRAGLGRQELPDVSEHAARQAAEAHGGHTSYAAYLAQGRASAKRRFESLRENDT